MKKSLKSSVVFSIVGLFSFSFCAIAQTYVDIADTNEIVNVNYPNGSSSPWVDAVTNYTVTPALDGKVIYFRLEGADGDEDDNGGGEGATVELMVNIGSGPNEIPVGATFRVILGEGDVWGAGGGGTGLAFRHPITTEWTVLAVAGGGGASTSNDLGLARPGRATRAGYWGRGTSTNENNGTNGGDATNNDDYGRGGDGYLGALSASGEPIGTVGPRDVGCGCNSSGTFGFGGGGGYTTNFNGRAGGGGGGYSGGGGGIMSPHYAGGGGGGSYANTNYAQWSSIIENGNTASPGHGFVEFQVRCRLSTVPEVEINDIVTLNDNECGSASDHVWLNVVADPLLGSACGARLVTYNEDQGIWDFSIPYSSENVTTESAANAYIEKGVEYNIILISPSFVVSSEDIITNKVIIYPKFEWQDEVSVTLNTPTITLNAQDLVNMTGTSTPLIENFSFQFLNDDGSIAEGEEKTFTSGAYTQKIGLVSFGGTVTCEHEMTVHVRAPEIAVDNCASGNVELIDNVHSLFWLTPNGYHTQWQSFSPESSGTMESLYFELIDNPNNGYEIPQNATLKIYRGEGVSGQVIYTKSLAGTLSRFNTITIDETLYLEEDHVYTFAISDPDTTDWGLAFYATEDYPRGVHFLWHDWDAVFRVSLTDVCDEDTGIVSAYFEETTIGTSRSKTYTISNTGSNILTVSGITSSDGQFTIGGHEANISPRSSTTFTVNFAPTSVGEQSGTITIHSNDLDDPTYSFDAKGVGVAPLQVSCQDNLVFYLESNDQNGKVDLGFWDLADTAEGPFTSATINGSDTAIRFQCTDIGDQDITLEISTDEGLSSTCSTTVTILPPITEIEDVTLYINRGAPLPTYEYDINTFNINCPVFSQPVQIAGLPSGSQFEVGTTTNTFEVSSGSTTLTYSFDVTVFENPFETRVSLDQGELIIEDWNTLTDDDQVTLSISDDGTVLYISGLNGSVELSGGALSYDGDTGTVVSVPINAITNGIVFHGRQGTNSITIADDLVLTGSTNGIVINDISNYVQSGAIEIDGDLTITGDADIVSTSGSYGGVVNLQGNTIDFRANNSGNLTFGTIAASGDALTDTNYLYSAGDINFTDTVTTAGDSNLVIRGEFVEQVASAVITTNELTLESAVSIDNSVYFLDTAPNNVNKLSSNTSNYLVGAIVFKDADALELGAINTDAVFVTADTFILTGATNLTIASNSSLIGAINQTATDINNPAQINHNGGTLILDSVSAYAFTGAFRYTAVSGATTRISNVQVLIDTPDHTQTFGALNFFFDALTIAAGSTVNVLNKANFNFLGTSLEGAGTIIGDVDIRNGATLNPGTDGAAGIITINGNLKLFTSSNENSNFAPFIDNDTDFDAVTVMGTVELADVDFEPTGSFVITDEDQEMVLINNDGTDAVIGTFMGHPEGSIVNIGGYASIISYVGGDGNDVVLKAFTIDPATSFTTVWRTDNPGASDDNTITIPTFAGETYDYYVDWGDGTAVQAFNTDTSPSHTYETVGEVTVRIAGTFPRIYFSFQNSNNSGDSQKIIDVAQWGDIQWTSMEDAFRGCYNLDVTAPDAPDLSGVTSMRYAFYRCFALTGTAAFSSWDVSNVEDFDAMFISAEPFNIDISGWTVTSATSMNSMFTGALAFNQPIGSWDVSSVTNMEGMFSNAQAFNQDLSGWNTANVISMANMFTAAKAFNGNITGWDTSGVERMHAMFFRAEAFDQDIGGWDVSKVTWMNAMFAGAISFDQDIGDWDISSLESDRAGNMFSSVTLSTANYDALLMGWSTLDTSTGETHIPTNLNFLGGSSQYCLGAAARQELIDTYNWTITDGGLSCSGILVSPKVYLNGASLNPNSGQESWMRDDLRVASLLPINSPYGDLSADANAFSEVEPNNNIVDWVWVELRDAADDTNIIAGRSALLQRDGDVVDVDGSAPVRFESVSSGNYYVVIKHRNHVGIMSSTAVSLSGTETGVDLSSDPSVVQGGSSAVVLLANGRYGMYTGDYDANAQIQNTDAYVVVQLIGGSGYEDGDMDLNTQIQNTDVNVLISPNIGRGEQFDRPNAPTEQLSTDVTLAFANAQITNDGIDDYYEADIVISGTTDFYVGSGQVYLDYATAAFGENISANGNIEYSQPDGSILGYSFGAFSPAYRDFIENDNITSRVSLSFQQNVGLTGLETAPELQITSTPKVLFHIKIRYTDVSEDAGMCFYSDGIFQDQFFTACGGAATADCTNTPGVQITNDTYDCSEAGVDTLGITKITDSPILLYPNPASTSFRIKGLTTASHVRVYDVNGRLIIEERRSDDSPIDMNAYDDGVYLVKITSDSATVIKRLIKKAG